MKALGASPGAIEDAYFQVASRIRYRLQLFNNLSFDKLDRLRLELKMKELGESSERLEQVRASQNENSVLREDIRKLILLLERDSGFGVLEAFSLALRRSPFQ